MNVHLTWNLVQDLRQLLQFPFMVNALRAGGIVAVVAGAIGYVMVLRRQSFAGHTLALIGFPGAAAAVWLGLSATSGIYAFCLTGALVIGRVPARESSALIGVVQAFALACGMLFVSLYHGFQGGLTNLLFGTIVGITREQVLVLLVAGALSLIALAALGRPLLFDSLDPEAARARGVPTRLIGTAFLVLLGVAAAVISQVTGTLLVFALLVAPPAAAARLTTRPGRGLLLSVLIALAVTWLGESAAYFSPYPIGFWVTTFAFAGFLLATFAAKARA